MPDTANRPTVFDPTIAVGDKRSRTLREAARPYSLRAHAGSEAVSGALSYEKWREVDELIDATIWSKHRARTIKRSQLGSEKTGTIANYLQSFLLLSPISILTQSGRFQGVLTAVTPQEIEIIDAEQKVRRLPMHAILSIARQPRKESS